MKFIRGLGNWGPRLDGCAATIGAFDGVHLGHRAVLGRLIEVGIERRLPTVVVTLEPLPREFFAPLAAPARLSSVREKIQLLGELNIDFLLCVRFDERLSRVSATEFIERAFVDKMKVKHMVVGDDVRFGHEQEGDIELLRGLGRKHDFEVEQFGAFVVDGERVSSTRVREALQAADFALAERLLGYPYAISGRVRLGRRLGASLGFPTANIGLHRHKAALSGVYAVEAEGVAERPLPAVANIGTRPTMHENSCKAILEVHVLDFDGDLYGRSMRTVFRHRLRDEEKFASIDELCRQIARDIEVGAAYFAR